MVVGVGHKVMKCKLRINPNKCFQTNRFSIKRLLIAPLMMKEVCWFVMTKANRFVFELSGDAWRLSCFGWFVTLPHTSRLNQELRRKKRSPVFSALGSGISVVNISQTPPSHDNSLKTASWTISREGQTVKSTENRWLIKQLPDNKFN